MVNREIIVAGLLMDAYGNSEEPAKRILDEANNLGIDIIAVKEIAEDLYENDDL